MPTTPQRFEVALQRNASHFGVRLEASMLSRLSQYYEILHKWNARLHLVAPCSPEEFATRHVLESLFLLPHVRPDARVVDLGSGGGLPIIPCLIAGNNLHATLIESSQKKAVFLREVLRDISANATVISLPFENLPTPETDYVTCRALERLTEKFSTIVDWSPPKSTLLIFGGNALRKQIESTAWRFSAYKIPTSERRFLYVIDRDKSSHQ